MTYVRDQREIPGYFPCLMRFLRMKSLEITQVYRVLVAELRLMKNCLQAYKTSGDAKYLNDLTIRAGDIQTQVEELVRLDGVVGDE